MSLAANDSSPSPPSRSSASWGAVGYVGLDVGQKEVTVCFVLGEGSEAARRWQVANDQTGAEGLARRLLSVAQEKQVGRLSIGLESTAMYWWHLANFLSETPILAEMQPSVYALNPSQVKGLKKAYSKMGKSDRLDAFFIAERLRLGHLPAPFQVDMLYAPLQRFTRYRFHLAKVLAGEKNYFLNLLFLSCSGLAQANPFSDPFGPTSSCVLEEYSTEELAQASVEELADFLQKKARGRLPHPREVAEALQRIGRHSYRFSPSLREPVQLVLATTMSTIRTLQRSLAAMDRTIARELEALPPATRVIQSVPGLGPVLTAGLLSEIGSIHRFRHEAALAKYAGLVWNQNQSGEFQGEDTPMSKAGNAHLRYYLVEGANSVRRHCPEYQSYYEGKFSQSTRHAHMRALVLTARKLVRLLDSLLREGALYQPPEMRQLREDSRSRLAGRPPTAPAVQGSMASAA